MLQAISPIDGRYQSKTKELQDYFSEFALIKYRIFVEIQYFIALCQHPIPHLSHFDLDKVDLLNGIFENFNIPNALEVKKIEERTNHDVKAVEYFLKTQFDHLGLSEYKEFIHFGLTSQDVNNTAIPILIKHSLERVMLPLFSKLKQQIHTHAVEWSSVPMLSRTHGQPATPTLLGKEFKVYHERIDSQLQQLKALPLKAKFGGTIGNFNAHNIAYPMIDWVAFSNHFVEEYLGLERLQYTTQVAHYDNLAALFHALSRINTILIDFCRDLWTYISMDYFKQKVLEHEVGSSVMPHKINPIDFENAEGNLGIANAFFNHLANKLPVSRLQRDLTDSTVLRNIGVPFAHTLIAIKSISKGLDKLILNEKKINQDLSDNWLVISEAIQSILRREGFQQPYELLKSLTRGKEKITKEAFHELIDELDVSPLLKEELKQITPFNYTGVF